MRARLNVQGTAMHLSSNDNNDLWWLMVSPQRNMVRLVLLLLDSNAWRDDLPRIMRGALALQDKGSWPSTIANAWGVLAIDKFAAAFEAQPVAGQTVAGLAGASRQLDWSRDPKGGSLRLRVAGRAGLARSRAARHRQPVGANQHQRCDSPPGSVLERLLD